MQLYYILHLVRMQVRHILDLDKLNLIYNVLYDCHLRAVLLVYKILYSVPNSKSSIVRPYDMQILCILVLLFLLHLGSDIQLMNWYSLGHLCIFLLLNRQWDCRLLVLIEAIARTAEHDPHDLNHSVCLLSKKKD